MAESDEQDAVLEARAIIIEGQLAQLENERRTVILAIADYLIAGQSIATEEQLFDLVDQLLPLDNGQLNRVIEALNREAIRRFSSVFRNMFPTLPPPYNWSDTLSVRPQIEPTIIITRPDKQQ